MKTEQIKDEDVLKWILAQRYRATERKKSLQKRIDLIRADAGEMPTGIKSKISDIEDRIANQTAAVENCIVKVMDIIEYLPENSLERDICEYRHIDMMPWRQIQDTVPMSRSQCNRRYNEAIKMLLANGRVRKIVQEGRKDYREYLRLRRSAQNDQRKKA